MIIPLPQIPFFSPQRVGKEKECKDFTSEKFGKKEKGDKMIKRERRTIVFQTETIVLVHCVHKKNTFPPNAYPMQPEKNIAR